jgi:hypothetical protein
MGAHTTHRDDALHLKGTVTEFELDIAEEEFPGISAFYEDQLQSHDLPATFLDLLSHFGAFRARPLPR